MSQPAQDQEQFTHNSKVMPLLDHLSELRDRVVKASIGILIMFCIALYFSVPLIEFLRQPLEQALDSTADVLHFTGPMDVFLTTIKVSLLTAIITSSPIWFFQMWQFLEPALYAKEKKLILPFVVASVTLFTAGVMFSFFVITPLALDFLIGLGKEVSTPMITITDYVSLLFVLILGFGIIFELPLILVLLAILDLISAETLASHRRFVVVGVLVVAAIMTPPDPLSQIGMAVPLYFMYEVSILVIKIIKKRESRGTT